MLSKKSRLAICLLMALLLIVPTLVFALEPSAAPAPTDEKIAQFEKDLNTLMPKLMSKYRVPGAAIGIVHNGQVVFVKGYGYADKTNKTPVASDTVFQVGSISKTFTALGVMKLVEQGKIDLNAPIDKYLTRWHLPDSEFKSEGVTIRRLLNHTSGITPISYTGYRPGAKLPTLEESLNGQNASRQKTQLVSEPGTRYSYSGANYTLLQMIIEEVTGMPFAEYMQKEVLTPLGMTNSGFEYNEHVKAKTAKMYDALGRTLPHNLYTEKAAAGLYTTIEDLAKFDAANMVSPSGDAVGRGVLKKETLDIMQSRTEVGGSAVNYGLGYTVVTMPNRETLIAHNGTNRGWCAQYYMLPSKGEGLVILTNSDMGNFMINDLRSYWSEMEVGMKTPGFMSQMKTEMILKSVAGLLGGILLVYIVLFILQMRNGKRVYLAKAAARRKVWRSVRMALCLILLAAWYIFFYTSWYEGGWMITPHLPFGLDFINLSVMAWLLVLAVTGLFFRNKGLGCRNIIQGKQDEKVSI